MSSETLIQESSVYRSEAVTSTEKTEPTAVKGFEDIPDQKTEGEKSEIENDTKKKPKKKKEGIELFFNIYLQSSSKCSPRYWYFYQSNEYH